MTTIPLDREIYGDARPARAVGPDTLDYVRRHVAYARHRRTCPGGAAVIDMRVLDAIDALIDQWATREQQP